MRILIYIIILLSVISCNTDENTSTVELKLEQGDGKSQWNLEKENNHNKNRNDSTKWSLKNWKVDTENIKPKGNPILQGVFPVPDYSLANNNFEGLGNGGEWDGVKLKDKTIIYHSLYVAKNDTKKENEVFFTVVALTDLIDKKSYSHTNVYSTSRNHPHYAGQGFIKTKSSKIDFVAFTTADHNAYALVNMRLFDLRIGRIVLIAPKKDGTFRSLQLDSPIFSSDEMDKHIKGLLKNDKQVIDFFVQPDNI